MQTGDLDKLTALYHTAKYHRELLARQCNHCHESWSKEDWQVYTRDYDLACQNYKLLGQLVLLNTNAASHF